MQSWYYSKKHAKCLEDNMIEKTRVIDIVLNGLLLCVGTALLIIKIIEVFG